jgi:hypothetical protein
LLDNQRSLKYQITGSILSVSNDYVISEKSLYSDYQITVVKTRGRKMRSSIMFGVVLISTITALSLGVAFAEKSMSNTTQPTTNATTNVIDLQGVVEQLQIVTMQLQNVTEQLRSATEQQNVTKIQNITKLQNATNELQNATKQLQNVTNPFAKVKGKKPAPN